MTQLTLDYPAYVCDFCGEGSPNAYIHMINHTPAWPGADKCVTQTLQHRHDKSPTSINQTRIYQ